MIFTFAARVNNISCWQNEEAKVQTTQPQPELTSAAENKATLVTSSLDGRSSDFNIIIHYFIYLVFDLMRQPP